MVKRLEKKKEKVPFVDWFLSSNGATSVAVVILGFLAGVILLLCILLILVVSFHKYHHTSYSFFELFL